MNSNTKGAIAEAKIRANLLQKGLRTATPDWDHLPFDCIAITKDYKLFKIQIKYCKMEKGSIAVGLRSNHYDNRKQIKVTNKTYNESDVDIFAAYVPETDKCYYLKSDVLQTHKSSIKLRIDETNTSTKSNMASNYKDFPF